MERLHELGFVVRPENVVFLGAPGVGKGEIFGDGEVRKISVGGRRLRRFDGKSDSRPDDDRAARRRR
jgi:hypothetical protein